MEELIEGLRHKKYLQLEKKREDAVKQALVMKEYEESQGKRKDKAQNARVMSYINMRCRAERGGAKHVFE